MVVQKLNALVRPLNGLHVVRYDLGWAAGYQYEIRFPDDRWGDAQLILRPIRDYKVHTTVYEALERAGLKPDETLAHLNEFYPNGRALNEETGEHMRESVGSEMLNVTTVDALEMGAKAMFVFTAKKSMRSFLGKKGFAQHGKYRWYKLLYSG